MDWLTQLKWLRTWQNMWSISVQDTGQWITLIPERWETRWTLQLHIEGHGKRVFRWKLIASTRGGDEAENPERTRKLKSIEERISEKRSWGAFRSAEGSSWVYRWILFRHAFEENTQGDIKD